MWVKISEHFPWKPGIIVKVHPNQSFDVQEGSSNKDTPQRTLRHQPRVKMPCIPYQAIV